MTGTPLLSMVPRVRAKRAVSIFIMSGPISGNPSSVWSQRSRPWGLPVHTRQARTPARSAITPTHQYAWKPALTHSKICVGSGTVCPRSAKIVANRGMTNVMRKMMAPMPNVKTTAG